MESAFESERRELCAGMVLESTYPGFSNTSQKLSLGLYRSDYMVHQDLEDSNATPTIKQVEFNTIAASFGGLSAQTSNLHK